MPNIVLLLLATLFIAWASTRVIAWLIEWKLRKRFGATVRIGKIGLGWLKRVHLVLPQGTTLEVEKIWLSSCYVNQNIRKPIALCFDDVRIQADIKLPDRGTDRLNNDEDQEPPSYPHSNETTDNAATQETRETTEEKILKVVTFLQFVGFYLKNVTVMVMRLPIRDTLIHMSVQEFSSDVSLQQHSFQVSLNLNNLGFRVMKSSSEDTTAPFLAEVSLSTSTELIVSREKASKIKVLRCIMKKPQMMITEGMMNQLQAIIQQSTPAKRRQPQCTDQPVDKLSLFQEYFPQEISFTVSEMEHKIVRETRQRILSVSVKTFEWLFKREAEQPLDSLVIWSNGTVEEISVSSPQVKFANLNRIKLSLEVSPDRIDMTTELGRVSLHYHHEELQYWANVFSKFSARKVSVSAMDHHAREITEHEENASNESLAAQNIQQISPPRASMVKWFLDKKLTSSISMSDMSFVMSSAKCSGFLSGIQHSKILLTVSPGIRAAPVDSEWLFHSHDVTCKLLIDTVYIQLVTRPVEVVEAHRNRHYWNQLVYVGIIMVQGSKLGNEAKLEGSVDYIQCESSSPAVSALGQLVSALKGGRLPANIPPIKKTSDTKLLASMFRDCVCTITVKVSDVNIFLRNEYKVYLMFRLDRLTLEQRQTQLICQAYGIRLLCQTETEVFLPLLKGFDLKTSSVSLDEIRVTRKFQDLNVQLLSDMSVLWTTRLHMVLHHFLLDLQDLRTKLTGTPLEDINQPISPESNEPRDVIVSVNVMVQQNLVLAAQLSPEHRISIHMFNLLLTSSRPELMMEIETVFVHIDLYDIITLKGVSFETLSPEVLQKERASCPDIELAANRARKVYINSCEIIFPDKYNFAEAFVSMVNVQKWVKQLHKIEKSSYALLPADLHIIIQVLLIQIHDDPFEIKLGDNFELLRDECREHSKRKRVLDQKVEALRKQKGLLPAKKVEELYQSLAKKSAEIYIQRSKQLYREAPMRKKLFTWKMETLSVVALADWSMHGPENVVRHMRQIDKDSSYPDEGLSFQTSWCRRVKVTISHWQITLRDYLQPALEVNDMLLWGRLIGAEQTGAKRAVRSETVHVGDPWPSDTVQRNMPALKFYHDFSCDIRSVTIAHGACWEPVIAHVNNAFNLINKPSVDPSLPMPWWDKSRLLFHGRLTVSAQKMSCLYHASLDPFNTTEFMDWTWSNLILDWINCKFVLKGDLDIYARTASKYDDCRLLHLPNLRFCIRLSWLCVGDSNDHHSVMPCAPDKVPEYSLEEHDSFRAFRSQNLNVSVSLETKTAPGTPAENMPACFMYASTLRFLDQIKMCIASVSRPIRKGPLFRNKKMKKTLLTRHYKEAMLSVNFPKFTIWYWMSFAKQHGFELPAEAFSLQSKYELSLIPVEDGLIHRPLSSWRIRGFDCQLTSATVWLCSSHSETEDDVGLNVSLRSPVNRSFFISIAKVTYQRTDETEQEKRANKTVDEMPPVHFVQVHDLRGAWTKSNRNVLFGLHDSYLKAKSLKRNVSSDALKAFKLEGTPQLVKSRTSSFIGNLSSETPTAAAAASPSPDSKLHAGHAYSMLLKLVAETDSKSVAFTEETSNANMEQLHGIAACQTDTVVRKTCLIEVHNSQMLLKGCETQGYVIVSAAAMKILSCTHHPVWRTGQLRSKTTWVGSVDCMQYYATVDPGIEFSDNNISWLLMENVQEHTERSNDLEGVPEMVGSGHSAGGVVSGTVSSSSLQSTLDRNTNRSIQLQRIISRCKCQFFYASYGTVNQDSLPNIPAPPSEDPDMMEKEDGVDTFTLLHHDLNICSNPLQYSMILDIVNNLLLFVEPKKRAESEKLQGMKFELLLHREDDAKTPILDLQEQVRECVHKLKRLERELYLIQKEMEASNDEDGRLIEHSEDLEKDLYMNKQQMYSLNEELAMRISCFKESQLQVKAQFELAAKAQQAYVLRRNEVCFKFAQWRLIDDGQLGTADIVLRNFVYSKVNRDDDTWTHQLELGWVKMSNLLPNSLYKDVLVPRESLLGNKDQDNRQMTLRIMCNERPPVGGIQVKEHFEVNVVPMQIQLQYQFFKAMMKFFFPDKSIETDDQEEEVEDGKKKKHKKESKEKTPVRATASASSDDIDKMKERAAKNNTFLYIKIPQVPLRVSYKGEKEKNIEDVHDFSLVLPTLEYHNKIWTWFDLLMAMKGDSKRVLLSQAVKQKLHLKSRGTDEPPVTDVQQEEDKAKMLLGAKLLAGQEKPAKKSLFGKSQK